MGEAKKSERVLNEFPIFVMSQTLQLLKGLAKKKMEEKSPAPLFHQENHLVCQQNYTPKIQEYLVGLFKIGLKYASVKDVQDENKLLDKWKLLVPKAIWMLDKLTFQNQ